MQDRLLHRVRLLLFLSAVCCGSGHGSSMQGTLGHDSCKREFLISIEVETNETLITGFSKSNGLDKTIPQEGETKNISGQISQGCGDKYFRCRDLLVETLKVSHFVLFVPFEEGVHLVEVFVSNDSSTQSVHFGKEYEVQHTPQSCSLSTMFKVASVYYTVCVNFEENSVALHEIRLNRTSLSKSYMLPMPNGEYTFQPDQTIATASNFLYMEWNYNTYIFFAIDYFLYAIRPSENSIKDDYEPIGANCRNVKELVLTGNDGEILAYCDDHLVYYNIDIADWTKQESYENDGKRYACPDTTLQLSVHVFREQSVITYNITGMEKNVSLSNVVLGGVCYSAANHSYFAYIEEHEGLFLLDTVTANAHSVKPLACLNSTCELLLVEDKIYLIVQDLEDDEGTTMWVMDTNSELSLIFEVKHLSPNLLASVINMNVTCQNTKDYTLIIVAPVVTMIVFVTVIITISVVSYAVVRRVRKARRVAKRKDSDSGTLLDSNDQMDHLRQLTQPMQVTESQYPTSHIVYPTTAHHHSHVELAGDSMDGEEVNLPPPQQVTNNKNASAVVTASDTTKPIPPELVKSSVGHVHHTNNDNSHPI